MVVIVGKTVRKTLYLEYSMLEGKTVRITKKCITKGSYGVVKEFSQSAKKWEVSFDSPWIGWYSAWEFQVMGDQPSYCYSY